MRLIYQTSKKPVKVGDVVRLDSETKVKVFYFTKPHKPASSGKVTVQYSDGSTSEYYVGVIGAVWVEREDQVQLPTRGNASDADRSRVSA